jgi:two-component system sensor histidine kinase QseC
MRNWLRPSLARRVLFALLLAFGLVWIVLLAKDLHDALDEARQRDGLLKATQVLAQVVGEHDASEATLIVQAAEVLYNTSRRQVELPSGLGDLLFQLEARDGSSRYASKALGTQHVDIADAAPHAIEFDGHAYVGASALTPHWQLTLLEPRLDGPSLVLWLAAQYLLPLLIAFPLVLLPLWLAVHRGLRPLRQLVQRVSQRASDDFSPLDMHLPYVDLQPLVQAMDDLLAKSRDGIARERAIVQDAAHELRTPLAVVAAQAHALSRAEDPAAVHVARAALEAAVLRASHLVHQLLTLARLENRRNDHKEAVDLVAEARTILIAASAQAEQRDVEVALESPDRLVVELDRTAFHSVLENLLRNALAYGDEHGRVVVSLKTTAAGAVVLSVADNGPGITPEDQAHLFDRFHRGRHVCAPGAGLGLAIVKQAVNRLGGSIDITSGLDNRGIGFQVTLTAH